MGKKSFLFYDNWAVLITSLSDADAGALIKSVCCHRLGEPESKINETLEAIGRMMKATMDDDAEKYEETCEKRRASASLGGKQKAANASKCYQMEASVSNSYQELADKDKDKEKDNDKDNDIHTVYEEVQAYYNSLSNLPKCKSLTKTRIDAINELKDAFTIDEIKEVLKKADGISWLCGNNDKHWKADFDWLINIDNFVRVQEGRYDSLGAKKNGFKDFTQQSYDWDEINRELGIR